MSSNLTQGATSITANCPDTILRCGHCSTVLGVSGNLTLTVGAVLFNETVSLRCAACKRVKTWRPSKPSAEDLRDARR